MRLVWGEVTGIDRETPGAQWLAVEFDDGTVGTAVNYPALSGSCARGERVLLNTTAVQLGLGTGGQHFVIARGSEPRGVELDDPSGGHVMKLRYSPLQRDVVAVESPESPHHAIMAAATGLSGTPVVCCGLHSQVPLVAAAVKTVMPGARVTYCMIDSAALALPLSEVIGAARTAGLIDATISCGQAFGGEFEAVNLHSGLLAARHVTGADVVVAGIGPGVVGTATPYGHGGVAQGEALNAVASLEGRPIAALRLSFADARPRHQVVSHHTLTALSRIALTPVMVAVPDLPVEQARVVEDALSAAGVWERHQRQNVEMSALDDIDVRDVRVKTMGRGPEQDPAFFAAAYAAGIVAARAVS